MDSTVDVPPGSASEDTTVTISEFDTTDPNVPLPPSGFDLLGQVVSVSTNPPATFSAEYPATLVIAYDESIVPPGVEESALTILHSTDSTWEPVPEPCSGGVPGDALAPDPCISDRDSVNNTITIKTTQFSFFGLGAPAGPSCDGSLATIVGTNGHDVLIGTNGADVIVGWGGNDVIVGLGGDDVICAGDGHDIVIGGRGDDTILGEEGNDLILGQRGSDTIDGGPDSDRCHGGPGIDSAVAESCERTLRIP